MTEYNRSNGGAAALVFARKLTGLPYVYGGEYPEDGGTDCSGLVQWAYAQIGVDLPRTTETQYTVNEISDRSIANEVGDLLFIAGDPIDPNPGHVVMYVAPGEVFEAEETGTRIGQFPFDTDAWEFRTRPALALPEAPPPAPPAPLPPAKGHPTAAQLKKAGLVAMADIAQAEQAEKNGWHLWYWASTHFVAQVGAKPDGVALYANAHWETKN